MVFCCKVFLKRILFLYMYCIIFFEKIFKFLWINLYMIDCGYCLRIVIVVNNFIFIFYILNKLLDVIIDLNSNKLN